MSHGTRWAGMRALLLVVLLAACSDSPTGPTNPPPPPPPSNPPGTVVLGPDAVVVDSTVLDLLSDLAERETGTFRFAIIGSPVPAIEAGKIIIGAQDGGFLRRVTAMSVSGSVMTLQTGPATLTEAVERGNIQLSFVVDQPIGPSPRLIAPNRRNTPASGGVAQVHMEQLQPQFLAEGVAYSQGDLSLAGRDLCKDLLLGTCPEFISLTIEEGSIGFTPEIDAKIVIEDFTVEEFHLIATGTLALDLLVKAVASQDFTTNGEIKLAELSANFAATVGPLPVTGVITFKFMAGFTAEANLSTSFQTGASASTVVSTGARYADETWSGVWETSLATTEKPTEWTAQADGNVRVYVRPELDLRFYHIVGPSIQVEPWVKAEGHIGTEQCELAITAGMDSKLSLIIEFLTVQIADWNTDFNTDPVDIFRYPCPIGAVEVTTTTTGDNPDTDGYTVTLDGGDSKPIDPAGTVFYTALPVTTYSIGLGGVAENCTVAGDNPQQADVTAGDTTTVAFAVECAADTGDLEVTVATSGDNVDSDGYTVNVDGTQAMAIGTNGTVTFAGLAIGEHSVSLEGVANNCTVVGNISRTATVAANATEQVSYEVMCASHQITVQAQTAGEPIDPDGYTVTLDDVSSKSLDVNGNVVFQPVTAGIHKLELTGMAANCSVDGENPRDVDVVDGESAGTTFVVSCGGGSLVVNTSTTGSEANLDPDGYTVVVDGTESQAIENDGQVSFPGLADGTHTVELQGVDAPCVVIGFNPRDVEVPGEETFEVQCGETGPRITFLRDYNVWQVLPDGNGEQQLTSDGVDGLTYGPNDWSPDGTRMAFSRAGAIWTADPDGSDLVQVTSPAAGVSDQLPHWSPDGTRLTFNRQDNPAGFIISIMTVKPDGTDLVELLAGNGADPTVEIATAYFHPSWTPDGRIIYVEALSDQRGGADVRDNYVSRMNADGTGLQRLTSTRDAIIFYPTYSPEGHRIAFRGTIRLSGDPYELIVMNADGSNVLNLTNGVYDAHLPRWSPDGNQIAIGAAELGVPGSHGVWLVDADGSNWTRLTDGGQAPAWRALP